MQNKFDRIDDINELQNEEINIIKEQQKRQEMEQKTKCRLILFEIKKIRRMLNFAIYKMPYINRTMIFATIAIACTAILNKDPDLHKPYIIALTVCSLLSIMLTTTQYKITDYYRHKLFDCTINTQKEFPEIRTELKNLKEIRFI